MSSDSLVSLLHSDVHSRLKSVGSITELNDQYICAIRKCIEYYPNLSEHKYHLQKTEDGFSSWRRHEEGDTVEESLAYHPRVRLILAVLLDRIKTKIEELATEASKSQGLLCAVDEDGVATPNGQTPASVSPIEDLLSTEIRTQSNRLYNIAGRLPFLCRVIKSYELSRSQSSTVRFDCDEQAAIDRVRVATQMYVSRTLPKVASTALGKALVTANTDRLKHLLRSKTPPPEQHEEMDVYLEPFICVLDECFDQRAHYIRTFAQRKDWILHMWNSMSAPRWKCEGDHSRDENDGDGDGNGCDWVDRVSWPITVYDREEFRDHMQAKHSEEDPDRGAALALFNGKSAWYSEARDHNWVDKRVETRYGEGFISACMFCGSVVGVPDRRLGRHESPFANAELEDHICNHLQEVARVVWHEAKDVLKRRDASVQTPGHAHADDHDDSERRPRRRVEGNTMAPASVPDETWDGRSILHHLIFHASTDRGFSLGQPRHPNAWLLGPLFSAFPDIRLLIDQPDVYGQTPAHYAARGNMAGTIMLLLEEPPRPEGGYAISDLPLPPATGATLARRQHLLSARDQCGFSPLLLAVMHGHFAVPQMLILELGIPVDDEALRWAARGPGGEGLARMLLRNGPAVLAVPDSSNGLFPLHEAAARGNRGIVRALLDAGANVNCTAARGGGWTALHLAAGGNHISTMRLLLQRGALVRATACDRFTPLHCAALVGHYEAVRLLLKHGADHLAATAVAKWTPLHYAVVAGHWRIVFILKDEFRVEVDTDEWFGWSLKAAIAADDMHGWSLLDLAAYYGHSSVVNTLLFAAPIVKRSRRRRANHVRAPRPLGPLLLPPVPMTPLQIAAAANDIQFATALLPHGSAGVAAVDGLCVAGLTPLFYAARAGHADMVELLLDAGADARRVAPGTRLWRHVTSHRGILDRLSRAGGSIDSSAQHELENKAIREALQQRSLKNVTMRPMVNSDWRWKVTRNNLTWVLLVLGFLLVAVVIGK